MKTKQRKEGRKEDPRSRRAVVRAFADEKSAGVRAAPRSACSSAGRRAVCGGLLSCLLQRSAAPASRAAFFLGRSHPAGFLSGSISSFPRHLACQPDSQHKTGPKAPLASPQERGGDRAGRWVGSSPGPGTGGCQRQRTRPKGACAEHTRARRELKTSVWPFKALGCAYVKYLAL